ncbi:MAG: WecB/TagA/CpsF family glycosyltransferase [Hydrococcus sp. C42_A2020_068]|uniref:WecB/TagA/CpsF family glycosyltransferase n=1 Tax=Pleurocapsa sp. PCC 7327 TaxID=118163 RepID=UPI00029FC200|nr:WecB/TagA/CpsF family glycosyltransferase [Pleurocapsa sp. PCC 7327]AFY78065.1 exopolysaccharide biosynthesis protein, WecB/TagA/CpsF family [Pleurocapsa sp. PCC 7327]MBF2022523.1 WecB/TagA/CpsF family glycosyltransferase [Hydrococcus sp. C42_A2020_068]
MLKTPKTFSVLKLPVHLFNDYTSWLLKRLHQRAGTHVITLNAEMAILAQKNPNVARSIREADLVIPDGAGIVLYLRLRGQRQQRCPGIELAESLLKQIGRLGKSYPIAFYGGKPEIVEKAAQTWRQKVPGISIISNHGYLSPAEEDNWKETLKVTQPKLILVGLGVPRQEFWIRQNRSLCPEAIWIGVGGSFDIWSGTKERAPVLLRENNLEWLYRLYQEPWRWKRMLALPEFFWRALLAR